METTFENDGRRAQATSEITGGRMQTTFLTKSTLPYEDPALFEEALRALPPQRQYKIATLKQSEDRLRSLAAGLLLKEAFEAAYPGAPFPEIAHTKSGKPYFPDYPAFCFSLSHSGAYAALLVSSHTTGVDVQEIRTHRFPEMLSLADRYFAPAEAAFLHELPEEKKVRSFFRLWTLKESLLKALGTGLTLPMRSFTLVLPPEEDSFRGISRPCIAEVTPDFPMADPAQMVFAEWNVDDRYTFAGVNFL